MALRFTKVTAVRSAEIFGWSVQMRDDNGILVRVLVADKEHDPTGDQLNARRAEIERIATMKYTAGEIDSDGTVRV
jgi:hypothetical protein